MEKKDSGKTIGRDNVLSAVRRVVDAAGGKRISQKQFLERSGLRHEEVFRNFARWEEVLVAAGYSFRRHNEWIETATLLEDWGNVARKIARLPTHAEYKVHGSYCTRTLDVRFGGWRNVAASFRKSMGQKPEWAEVWELCGESPEYPPVKSSRRMRYTGRPGRMHAENAKTVKTIPRKNSWRRGDAPRYGARLDCGALQHAPTNETGVIYFFGTLAERLGFCVESMRTTYPDCEAKRLVAPDLWERVRIEFEYESRNFKLHGHATEGCDLIVCWTHNWPECPLEVIALSDEFKRLQSRSQRD